MGQDVEQENGSNTEKSAGLELQKIKDGVMRATATKRRSCLVTEVLEKTAEMTWTHVRNVA